MIESIKIRQSDKIDLFAFPYGIDDFIVFASVLKKYKEKNTDKKIFLLVLAPSQPAHQQKSYIKELAEQYDYVDEVYEMEHIVLIKNNKLMIDKKRIEHYVKVYSNYVNFDKKFIVELNAMIKRDDYRYNLYFQISTVLGLRHEKPEYFLPKPSEKNKKGASLWLRDHGIKKNEKFVIAQVKTRLNIKDVDLKLFDKALEQAKMKNARIVEMNGSSIKGSANLSPDEVSNLTAIEIVKKSEAIIGNTSFAYQLGGFLNKKTIVIINPNSIPLIRDFNFNFSPENIVFLATDDTLQEWNMIRATVPFVGKNDPKTIEAEVELKSINFYNVKQQKYKVTRSILMEKDKVKKAIEAGDGVEPPLLWNMIDYNMLKSGEIKETNTDIKYQALEGLPVLLAYEELGVSTIKALVTNIYKPFF